VFESLKTQLLTLQEEKEAQQELGIGVVGLSGSRRRNGNTKFLVAKALEAASAYVDEINTAVQSAGLSLRLKLATRTFETHFDDLDEITASIAESEAILLGTPVYFGSISPTLNEALRLTSELEGTDLTRKSASSIAVGTQRNGGQETAIEDLWRWYLDRNVTFVGNGPVTSQYGGTAWGGARLTAKRDVYGIHTTMGAGKTLMQDAMLRATGERVLASALDGDATFFVRGDVAGLDEPRLNEAVAKCSFLFFSDEALPSHAAHEMMNGITSASDELEHQLAQGDRVRARMDFLSLNTEMKNVKDCAACAICPPGNEKTEGVYGCIYDDDLNRNFHRFYEASAIICTTHDRFGLTPPEYWKALNRMRSVRRNNYMLTGKMGSVVYQPAPGSQIPLKWLIRNNMPLLASSRDNSFEFGRTLYRETLLRRTGQNYFKGHGITVWTPPTHHE
jgi:multimeric flavodoxin WrbA